MSATTSGTTTNYLWDINQPLPMLALERNGGSTIRDYSYGIGLNSMTASTSNYFYLLDAYSSVANVTSSSGAAEWTYANDPFGTATATKNDPSAPTNLMRFDGQLLDPTTALYDLRARTYDPGLGRFLQMDPRNQRITAPHESTYVYVADRPLVFEDPSGAWWKAFIDVAHGAGTVIHGIGWGVSVVAGGAASAIEWIPGLEELGAPLRFVQAGGIGFEILGGFMGLRCVARLVGEAAKRVAIGGGLGLLGFGAVAVGVVTLFATVPEDPLTAFEGFIWGGMFISIGATLIVSGVDYMVEGDRALQRLRNGMYHRPG